MGLLTIHKDFLPIRATRNIHLSMYITLGAVTVMNTCIVSMFKV